MGTWVVTPKASMRTFVYSFCMDQHLLSSPVLLSGAIGPYENSVEQFEEILFPKVATPLYIPTSSFFQSLASTCYLLFVALLASAQCYRGVHLCFPDGQQCWASCCMCSLLTLCVLKKVGWGFLDVEGVRCVLLIHINMVEHGDEILKY